MTGSARRIVGIAAPHRPARWRRPTAAVTGRTMTGSAERTIGIAGLAARTVAAPPRPGREDG